MPATDHLAAYRRKRDFRHTPEPAGKRATSESGLRFVVQKHAARQLHYDFRLELDGTLKSWAVPKGPSLDPSDRRMAVQVEDHPLDYGDFEGVIPPGQYGAGSVIVWDRGTWVPAGDARKSYQQGKLKFELNGEKLRGHYTLVRMRGRGTERQPAWLLIKERDAAARPAHAFDVTQAQPDSVLPAAAAPAARPRKKEAHRLPLTQAPQLATLVDAPPGGDGWQYEVKLDGYRLLARIERGDVRCFTRNGHDWTHRMPELARALRGLPLESAWLDGELVAAGDTGRPDFQTLQNAFEQQRSHVLHYIVFDLPFHDGQDLRGQPLHLRRERLQKIFSGMARERIALSGVLEGDPTALLEAAGRAGLEGLIGKRLQAAYRAGRSTDWIKLKTRLRQEFVIGGFSEPQGSRRGIGSLLLGVHDAKGDLRYAGNVGSGLDHATLGALRDRLAKIETPQAPFADPPARVGAGKRQVPHWVRPRLIAEVSFAQWTASGHVRQAVFHGLRSDKPPRRITKEQPAPVAAIAAPWPRGLRVTHPERVIDRSSGITKGELVAFYAQVATLLLPHLKQRAVSLLRAPQGVAGQQFFQKHAEGRALVGVDVLDRALYPAHEPLLGIAGVRGLLSAAQMNVVEFHTWNATTRDMAHPDRMVFDLDPGAGVAWAQVQEGAHLLRALLDEIGLTGFLKTSGGKGLHVVVPITPRHEWDAVKAFSKAVVEHLAQVIPQRFVAKSGPRNRVGRIFVDYLRNGLGATTVTAWSARARPQMGVSVPLAWEELDGVGSASAWTVANVASRLDVGNAPWKGYAAARRGLARPMKKLGFEPGGAS